MRSLRTPLRYQSEFSSELQNEFQANRMNCNGMLRDAVGWCATFNYAQQNSCMTQALRSNTFLKEGPLRKSAHSSDATAHGAIQEIWCVFHTRDSWCAVLRLLSHATVHAPFTTALHHYTASTQLLELNQF